MAHGAAGQPPGQFVGVNVPEGVLGPGLAGGAEARSAAGLVAAQHRGGGGGGGPSIAEVGAAGAHLAGAVVVAVMGMSACVPLIGADGAAAGTAAATRQGARRAVG